MAGRRQHEGTQIGAAIADPTADMIHSSSLGLALLLDRYIRTSVQAKEQGCRLPGAEIIADRTWEALGISQIECNMVCVV